MTGKVDRFSDNHHMIDWIWKRQMGRYPQDLIVKPGERGWGVGCTPSVKTKLENWDDI